MHGVTGGFIDPGVFTWITPSESREVLGRTYKEWGNFIPEPRWKDFPLTERRRKTKTLGMWRGCEFAVQLPLPREETSPMVKNTDDLSFNTSPRFPSSRFHTSAQVFSDATPKVSHLSTPTTRPTAVVLFGRPTQTKSPTSHQPHRSFRVFFCLHLLWSVFRQQLSCRKVVTLRVGVSVFQGPSGRWRASIQLMTNWICWFELSSFNINFPHVSIILRHLGSVYASFNHS